MSPKGKQARRSQRKKAKGRHNQDDQEYQNNQTEPQVEATHGTPFSEGSHQAKMNEKQVQELWSDAMDSSESERRDEGTEPSNKKLKASDASSTSKSVSNDEVLVSQVSPKISPDGTFTSQVSASEVSPPERPAIMNCNSPSSSLSDPPATTRKGMIDLANPTLTNSEKSQTAQPIPTAHTPFAPPEERDPPRGLNEDDTNPPPPPPPPPPSQSQWDIILQRFDQFEHTIKATIQEEIRHNTAGLQKEVRSIDSRLKVVENSASSTNVE